MESITITPKGIKRFGFKYVLDTIDPVKFVWVDSDGKKYPTFTLAVMALNRRLSNVTARAHGYIDGHVKEALRRLLP